MNFLINLDLEGVNHVVGIPYSGLSRQVSDYKTAIEEGVLEVNRVAGALFDVGAQTVAFWDNHGGGHNVDTEKLDKRITILSDDITGGRRMEFIHAYHFDGLILIGYHAMEGTLGGVLAHTMSSKDYQYIRIGGKDVGEIAIDSYLAAAGGLPLKMVVSDDKGCLEAQTFQPGVVTVSTKTGINRNRAIFRKDEAVHAELYQKAQEAAFCSLPTTPLSFPAVYEIRYTRTERAAEGLERLQAAGLRPAYKGDAHTLTLVMESIADLQEALRA